MFFLYRIEVQMPDDTWLSFMLTTPSREDIQKMIRLSYPEARDIKHYLINPI